MSVVLYQLLQKYKFIDKYNCDNYTYILKQVKLYNISKFMLSQYIINHYLIQDLLKPIILLSNS
jgi:hypothetical protein